jgi:hypothetical protein
MYLHLPFCQRNGYKKCSGSNNTVILGAELELARSTFSGNTEVAVMGRQEMISHRSCFIIPRLRLSNNRIRMSTSSTSTTPSMVTELIPVVVSRASSTPTKLTSPVTAISLIKVLITGT